MMALNRKTRVGRFAVLAVAVSCMACGGSAIEHQPQAGKDEPGAAPQVLDPRVIEEASGAQATVATDGAVRIGWSRDDVKGDSRPPSTLKDSDKRYRGSGAFADVTTPQSKAPVSVTGAAGLPSVFP